MNIYEHGSVARLHFAARSTFDFLLLLLLLVGDGLFFLMYVRWN